MADVADDNNRGAQIWGDGSGSKVTRRRLVAGGAVIGTAALALGLYFGLSEASSGSDGTSINAQADPNSVGCFIDTRERVLEAMYTDTAMTPDICNTYCADGGYAYYALQWGVECFCGAAGTDLGVYGVGTCDFTCGGDSSYICGGYWAFTVYEVGTIASPSSPTTSSTTDPGTGGGGSTTSCEGETPATIRFASTTAYFEGGGCGTLTDMFNAQDVDAGPLYVLDESDNVIAGATAGTGRWLLDRDLRVVQGSTLLVHGTSIGGDADVLRIKSTDSEFYNLRGYGGNLHFESTTVTSWDTDAGGERIYSDDNTARSYISCITQFDDSALWDCTGASSEEWGECRMDIINSVMGNLGYYDAESYGLTWKVRGACELDAETGLPENHEIFEDHNVYGDITGSEIYGMYYGHYSYGHQDGFWDSNVMRDNTQYGFDPHDDSDNLVISNNVVFGNGNHGIIASKRCNGLTIYNNEVYDGGLEAVGIFLHRSSDFAEVYQNNVHDMQDSCIAVMESFDSYIHDNVCTNTGQFGIRFSLGSGRNVIENNSFDGNTEYGLYTYMGSDIPDVPGNDGYPKENVFNGNAVSNVPAGVHIQEGTDNVFTNNVFTGCEVFEFESSSGNTWEGNTIDGGCLADEGGGVSGSDLPGAC